MIWISKIWGIVIPILFLTTSIVRSSAQPIDGWINDQQQYFSIKNIQRGIIRLTADSLVQAGVPLSSITPQNLQLFFRGIEIPIHVEGENLGTVQYIEFVGQPNDGWFDTGLYVNPRLQANPYVSFFNDTATYFLTWNNSIANRRYQNPSITGGSSQLNQGFRTSTYYSADRFYSDEIGPLFGGAEGWFSLPEITLGSTTNRTLTLEGNSGNGDIVLEVLVCGLNNEPSLSGYNHHLRIKIGSTILLDTLFRGREQIKRQFSIAASQFGNTLTIGFESVNDLGIASDRMGIAYIKADYPATFSLSAGKQYQFKIPASSENRWIVFTGLTAQTPPIVYETQNRWRFVPVFSSSGWVLTLPPSSEELSLFVTTTPISLSYQCIKPSSMLLSRFPSDFIIVTHPSLLSAVEPYAHYRNALMVNIETLYNRYAYGIRFHPLAIRYFLRDYITAGYGTPQYLFLIGKGINQVNLKTTPSLAAQNLIPVGGSPPSDMLITNRLTSNADIPEIVVGRLSALSLNHVTNYFNKVKEHEQRQTSMGAKNALLFGGGNNAAEQNAFAAFLNGYRTIINDTLLGGFSSTFLKNSSAPLVTTQSDSVRSLLEKGPLSLTFFGHAWSGGFDQNIDEPQNFNNQGKYPLIIANSCYSGNVFDPGSETISEKWVLIPQKGAIGFLASTNLGYPTFLDRYTREFYRNLLTVYYGQSYGKAMLETTKYLLQNQPSIYTTSTCLEFLLHGDPSLHPVVGQKPDPALFPAAIKVRPAVITTAIDSFAVQIIVSNPGKALNKPLSVFAERVLPNGERQEKIASLEKLFYSDTLEIYFPTDRLNAPGLNRVTVTLDHLSEIEELNEGNNTQSITFAIKSTDIYPVFPLPNAIEPQSPERLKASTGDPFAAEVQYVFQIDTTVRFNSFWKKTGVVQSPGGVVEWQLPASLNPNQPYFWRVGTYKTNESEIEWQNSTFIVQPGKEGWMQQGLGQLETDEFQFIEIDPDGRWSFSITPRTIKCINYGSYVGTNASYINYDIDGNGDYGSCGGQAAIVVVVVDPLTLLPWTSDRQNFGHVDYPKCPPRTRPNRYFTFPANESARINLRNFLLQIPNGNYILAYSVGNAQFETWSNADYLAFENLGATRIRTVPNNYPYIFFTRKGYPDQTEEVIGQTAIDVITFERQIQSNFYYGRVMSTFAGPSQRWEKISWEPKRNQISNTDSLWVNIYGTGGSYRDTLLLTLHYPDTVVNIQHFTNLGLPFLKLEYYTYDFVQKTPVELKSWKVEYTPYPELAINPKNGFYFHSSIIDEGDSLAFAVGIANISRHKAQSIVCDYSFQNQNGTVWETKTKTIDSIASGSFYLDTITFDTRNRRGNAILIPRINYPDLKSQTFPEYFTFNNIAVLPITIKTDNSQPLLIVKFDGRTIMNREIVSSRPEILIELQDKNPFLPLSDTGAIEIWLTTPEQKSSTRISIQDGIASGTMEWHPATSAENRCRLVWRPVFAIDGIYELTVSGLDATGNSAGNKPYRVQFEVINRSTITRLLNYPNPFSTSTRFVFTLTGSKIPDELRIQIYSVSGRLVREITLEELGPIRIGENITQFAWDGTDQYGDRLANGVYFYRVITKIDGIGLENRESKADSFFIKEFGKLYLMK
ncbi:MAG TPA: C25 family cysteine peptidase [Salinivirgaceae bacterium]|nr:C25 family cysteine peptidase [Salinivirgaceae bacterium]